LRGLPPRKKLGIGEPAVGERGLEDRVRND
jgi:hypothetical protein